VYFLVAAKDLTRDVIPAVVLFLRLAIERYAIPLIGVNGVNNCVS